MADVNKISDDDWSKLHSGETDTRDASGMVDDSLFDVSDDFSVDADDDMDDSNKGKSGNRHDSRTDDLLSDDDIRSDVFSHEAEDDGRLADADGAEDVPVINAVGEPGPHGSDPSERATVRQNPAREARQSDGGRRAGGSAKSQRKAGNQAKPKSNDAESASGTPHAMPSDDESGRDAADVEFVQETDDGWLVPGAGDEKWTEEDLADFAEVDGKSWDELVAGEGEDNAADQTDVPESLPIEDILKSSAKKAGVDYASILNFFEEVDKTSAKSLSEKLECSGCRKECDRFVSFMSSVFKEQTERSLENLISAVVSYLSKTSSVEVKAIDIIRYCNEISAHVPDGHVFVLDGIGYTKLAIMVENAFMIEYLNAAGVSDEKLSKLMVGNSVDDDVDAVVQLVVAVAYFLYGKRLGESVDKAGVAYQRIKNEKPEMLSVLDEGDYEAFYQIMRTFGGSSTVGIDLRDVDLNIDSYSPGEAASLYAAVIAKLDELAAKYHKRYDNADVERIVDHLVSRGYRASYTNAIEYYCDELMKPAKSTKPIGNGGDRDSVTVDHGMRGGANVYIPAGYGLSKSHVETGKPYTETFGIPFINIRHPLFKTIAMKYSNRYSRKGASKGKPADRALESRARDVEANADKAERQLIKAIKKGSLMSKFIIGGKSKDTQVDGEGVGVVSSIEKGLRRVTSFASNQLLVKNILKLIKMAMDGDEVPVSRNTLVVSTNPMSAYERNPLVPNEFNDQYANVRVFDPVKPEKSAAVSKKYLKQFYNIVNPLENADEYIACGAFSSYLPVGAAGNGMFSAQLRTVSGGTIDPSSVPDAAITAFRQDIIEHGGYPYTYVLTGQSKGGDEQFCRIARHNNFIGDLIRLDVDLVAIHVKKGGMDGIFIMENHDAEVLFG